MIRKVADVQIRIRNIEPWEERTVRNHSRVNHTASRNVGNSLVARTIVHPIMLSTIGSNAHLVSGGFTQRTLALLLCLCDRSGLYAPVGN